MRNKVTSSTSDIRKLWKDGHKEFKGEIPPPTYPIFSWNREPIKLSDVYGDKGSFGKIVQVNPGDSSVLDVYAGAISSITINWRYITQTMPQMEQFEIMYLSDQSIKSVCYLDMLFFDQGPFKFEVFWDEQLNNLQTNDDDFAYISVGGQLTITGPMIVILDEQIPRLEKIVFRLYVTSEKSPICEIPLPQLVSHSVLEMEKVIHVNTQGEL